jgi:hypothetical protein
MSRTIAKASPRCPFAAAVPASSSWSVTCASALTTTTGCAFSLLCTMLIKRRMAAASSTDVPPNFITTTSLLRSNLLRRSSPCTCPLIFGSISHSSFRFSFFLPHKEKPTARSLLAVGSGDSFKSALLHPMPSSRRHVVIRVDMPVPVDVIRVSFWMRVFMKNFLCSLQTWLRFRE